MAEVQESAAQIANVAKLGADVLFLPGSSYYADGNVIPGVAATLGGMIARSFFGPIGWAVAGLASFCLNQMNRGTTQSSAASSGNTGERQS